jgi:hypothetical protein
MDLSEYKVIKEKDGMKFARTAKNHYQIHFSMQNSFIHLPSIINLDLLKLLYELNSDIYEKTHLEKINEKEAVVCLLMKHFFQDLGLPQRYYHFHVERTEMEQMIRFYSQSIHSDKPEWIPSEAHLVPMQSMTLLCEMITPHKVNVLSSVVFHENHVVPPFMEKFIGMILHKIFNRLKQFIENYRT